MLKRASGIWGVLGVVVALMHATTTYGEERSVAMVTKQATDGTLDGWEFYCEQAETKCSDVWQLDDGVLICKGTPKGYIYTQRDYTDFVMRLEGVGQAAPNPAKAAGRVRPPGRRRSGPDPSRPKSILDRRVISGGSTALHSRGLPPAQRRWPMINLGS